VSATETNRFMLFREAFAVCCEGRSEHNRYTVWAVRASQETHYISAIQPNRLMLSGEAVAVCCEGRTEHTDTLFGPNAEFLLLKYMVHVTAVLGLNENKWVSRSSDESTA
jgi:hypothetical protein